MNILLRNAIVRHIRRGPLKNHYNYTYRTQKYSLEIIIDQILFVLRTGGDWRCLSDTKWAYTSGISWNTVYQHFNKLSKYGIFKSTYIELLHKYIKKSPNKKLKIQLTDTTFIPNQYGMDSIARNKYYKNKNVTKISIISDSKGIPINIKVTSGNHHDSKIVQDQLNEKSNLIDETINEQYKKYFLGDKGYDSKKLVEILVEENYDPIIPQNKRNTKNVSKIRELTKEQKKIYKKRIIIENLFSKIKRWTRRLSSRYDKLVVNYEAFLYISLCNIIRKI